LNRLDYDPKNRALVEIPRLKAGSLDIFPKKLRQKLAGRQTGPTTLSKQSSFIAV
jgi:hypothetical protein